MSQETITYIATAGQELQLVTDEYLQQKKVCSDLYRTLHELLPEVSRNDLNHNPELMAANGLRRSLRAEMNARAKTFVPRGVLSVSIAD